jgi:hypothetical protein
MSVKNNMPAINLLGVFNITDLKNGTSVKAKITTPTNTRNKLLTKFPCKPIWYGILIRPIVVTVYAPKR